MNSRHNLTKSKFLEMLHRQWWMAMQSEWQTENLQTPFSDSLCIGDAALPKIWLFVRLWHDFFCQFVSKLEFRVLVELFSIRLQGPARAVSVCFVPVRKCVTSGIRLLDYTVI